MSTTSEYQPRKENVEELSAEIFDELSQIRRQILENEDQSQSRESKNDNHELSTSTSIREEVEMVQQEQGNKNLESVIDTDINIVDNSSLFENSVNVSASTSKLNAKTPMLSRYHKFCNSIFKRRKISGDTTLSSRATTSFASNTKTNSKLDSLISDVDVVKKDVAKISDQMDKLKLSGNLIDEVDSSKENSLQASLNAKKTLIKSSKSLSEILRYNEDLVAIESEDVVSCQICDTSGEGKAVGRFHYDFSLGTNFSDKNVPRAFSNLKGNIIKHIDSNAHIKNANEKELGKRQKTLFKTRNYKVGMVLGRQAYSVLKISGSLSQYENEVSVLSAQGTDVGQLNHSRKFVAEFAKSIHTVLVSQMQKLVNEPLAATGKPTPIAVLADKMTPNRRTMQIVGFHGFVNDKFQSLMSGVPPLSGEDGIEVTKTLKSGLSSLNISDNELSKRMVGGAFDGEYVHLNVKKHLMDSLLISEESRDWYSFQWDPAHILELAEKDAKKSENRTQNSVGNVVNTISRISQSFSHGQSYRLLLEEAESEITDETGTVKARAPGHFSETRFATNSYKVLQNWIHNYRFYYRRLNAEKDDELRNIDNAPFVFSCAGLNDVYEMIGALSNALQKPDIPPWEISTIQKTYISTLEKMTNNIEPSNFKTDCLDETLFPTLSSAFKEVLETGEYKHCAILHKKSSVQNTRNRTLAEESLCASYDDALKVSVKSLHSFTSQFVSNLKNRIDKEKTVNKILSITGNLFDVTNILKIENEIPENITDDLVQYARLAKESGNFDSEIRVAELVSEYKIFSDRVKDISQQYSYVPKVKTNPKPCVQVQYPKRYLQQDLYTKLLTTPNLYNNIGNVLHLSLTALCRTHCEAVVEGMGSVMTADMKTRGKTDVKTVERESLIRWQGPHPASKSSSELIKISLDQHFKGRSNWHFCATDQRAKYFTTSEVLTRVQQTAEENEKISFDLENK